MWRVTLALWMATSSAAQAAEQYDIVVYGSTSGGIAAAIQAARMGKSVVLIEPSAHLGGLTSGGLGATDIGNKQAIGGIAREFYMHIARHYQRPEAWTRETREEYFEQRRGRNAANEPTMWTFEPHVAEQVFRGMLAEAHVACVLEERLELKDGVTKQGERIVLIRMESGREFAGRMFLDATYEGDLMAKAGVQYSVGREANAAYGETLNGVQTRNAVKHQFIVGVDPYVRPGEARSGLLPGVHGEGPGEEGAADHRVQAYNFRMCTTDVPENRVAWPKPADYDPLRYELLLRNFEAGDHRVPWAPAWMPNRKTDTNNNFAISTDHIGANYEYPEADYATRERIVADHVSYQQGLMWTLANDRRVPPQVQEHFQRLGLAKDEFTDNGHWPHQLYVREARRMVGQYVMTEHNCRGDRLAENAVGLAAYTMDSHNVQRYVKDGFCINEGDVQVGGFAPYPIAFGSIVPRSEQCTNLAVPVCLSASHIAYGSIRMEPVFMVLGQSAATAAALAIDAGVAIQQVDYSQLRERLLTDGQVLEWTGPRPYRAADPATLPGVVLDETSAELTGHWDTSRSTPGYVGPHGYLHDGHDQATVKRARFALPIERPGRYEVRISYAATSNRASNVPVVVHAADGVHRFVVDQRKRPSIDGMFHRLGVFTFEPGQAAAVEISNAGANGHVIVDSVQLLPAQQ